MDAVVLPQEGSSHPVVYGCRLSDVSSVTVQYGYQFETPEFAQPTEDLCLVTGDRTRRALLRVGGKPEQVMAVGSPYHDDLRKLASDRSGMRESLFRRFAVPKDVPLVLWCSLNTQPIYPEHLKARECEIVCRALTTISSPIHLVVKTHPSDTEHGRLELLNARKHSIRCTLVTDVDANQPLILGSDLMLANYSTLVVAAAACGRPTCVVDASSRFLDQPKPFVSEGLADVAIDEGALACWLAMRLPAKDTPSLEAASTQSALLERLGPLDGQSACRAVDRIEQLVVARGRGA